MSETVEKEAKEKVAIHIVPTITREGYYCTRFYRFRVAAGRQPYGPRGGTCGNVEDGEWVSGRFRTWKEAQAFAIEYLKEMGAKNGS